MKKSLMFGILLLSGVQGSIMSMSSIFEAMKGYEIPAAYAFGTFVMPAANRFVNKCKKMYKGEKDVDGNKEKFEFIKSLKTQGKNACWNNLNTNLAYAWVGVYASYVLKNKTMIFAPTDLKNFVVNSWTGRALAAVTLVDVLFGAYNNMPDKSNKKLS